MIYRQFIYRALITFVVLVNLSLELCAQDTLAVPMPVARMRREGKLPAKRDSLVLNVDSVVALDTLSLSLRSLDSAFVANEMNEEKQWLPNPKKAMWLAIVFPGGGQIYNRKYWKLPIIYGGFMGCVYALNWNNTMYRDYSQAYVDIMDDDPNTKSYEDFIPPSYDVNQNLTRIQDLFRKKKNYYRRYRDLSIFCMIGVYALSIIDAYVDAELSDFNISRDLSMKVKPAIINERQHAARSTNFVNNSYGLQCSLSF